MKNILKVLGLICLALALTTIILIVSIFNSSGTSVDQYRTTVSFINNTGQLIRTAEIIVSDNICSAKELAIDGELKCSFEISTDGSYSVAVTLQDGTTYLEPDIGYVTGGWDIQNTIIITQQGDIELVLD